MSNQELLAQLRKLEVEFHQPDVRSDPARLNELLHDEFAEVGRSGKTYDKSTVIEALTRETKRDSIHSQDFELVPISSDAALLLYRSARITASGRLSGYSLRSSLWLRTGDGWQIRYHQGTAVDAFS